MVSPILLQSSSSVHKLIHFLLSLLEEKLSPVSVLIVIDIDIITTRLSSALDSVSSQLLLMPLELYRCYFAHAIVPREEYLYSLQCDTIPYAITFFS